MEVTLSSGKSFKLAPLDRLQIEEAVEANSVLVPAKAGDAYWMAIRRSAEIAMARAVIVGHSLVNAGMDPERAALELGNLTVSEVTQLLSAATALTTTVSIDHETFN